MNVVSHNPAIASARLTLRHFPQQPAGCAVSQNRQHKLNGEVTELLAPLTGEKSGQKKFNIRGKSAGSPCPSYAVATVAMTIHKWTQIYCSIFFGGMQVPQENLTRSKGVGEAQRVKGGGAPASLKQGIHDRHDII